MVQSRREAATELAEELLTDLELSRAPAPELLKKVSRLARLLDDTEAMDWLAFEMHGYPSPFNPAATKAARKSNRFADKNPENGKQRYWSSSLSRIHGEVEVLMIQLAASQDSGSSTNARERGQIANRITDHKELIGKIVGAQYAYVMERAIELRFGAAIEGAFTVLRNDVDARIASLAPKAATKLSAALESASSGNPEHWSNAASECRRLLKEIADELRPPGEPVDGRPMTEDKYINRLIDWIAAQGSGTTLRDVITSDLQDLGKRIDAFHDAGHKGAHAEVSQYEASRFIAGTYLLVGDILRLWTGTDELTDADGEATGEEPSVVDGSSVTSEDK